MICKDEKEIKEEIPKIEENEAFSDKKWKNVFYMQNSFHWEKRKNIQTKETLL